MSDEQETIAAQPELSERHPGPAEWVTHAQQMVNMAAPRMSLDPLPENGVFDSSMTAAVRAFQERASIKVDGIIGPETWGALYEAVSRAQTAGVSDDGSGAVGGAGSEAEAETPPTAAEIDRGREVVNWLVEQILPQAHEFAERLHDVPPEIWSKAIDGIHAGMEVAELLHLIPEISAVATVGSVFAIVAVPFAMWYDSIAEANEAGDLATLRWSVYNPYIDGCISGLYGQSPHDHGPLFAGAVSLGYDSTSMLGDSARRGTIALLMGMGFGNVPDEAHPMSAEEWHNHHYAIGAVTQGLEIAITHQDR